MFENVGITFSIPWWRKDRMFASHAGDRGSMPKKILYYDVNTPYILNDVQKGQNKLDVHVISTFINIYHILVIGIKYDADLFANGNM